MVLRAGIEPATPSLPMTCSTTEPPKRTEKLYHWLSEKIITLAFLEDLQLHK